MGLPQRRLGALLPELRGHRRGRRLPQEHGRRRQQKAPTLERRGLESPHSKGEPFLLFARLGQVLSVSRALRRYSVIKLITKSGS
jgi:hypothetical protein